MLILFVPIWLLIALAIMLADGRPVFFSQERWGLCRRHFHVLKFWMVSLNDTIFQI
jgi:lipopolysaccharide/colanic/teichoic acid biosynthesis glycosyltransferase